MKRRSHKKSRGGCLECKRRHIKCDEKTSGCGSCVAGRRRCRYPGHIADATPRGASPRTRAGSPHDSVPRDIGSNRTASQSIPDFLADLREQLADPVVNINQMELIIHFIISPVMPHLDNSIVPNAMETVLESALEAPYLLHQILALSARHLAYQHPEKSDFYLHQAVQLQTRSLSMFKTSQLLLDKSKSVPMLIYSSFLGTHLLADTLICPSTPFEHFHDKLMQTIFMLRGVRAVADTSWETIRQSKLNSIIKWGAPPYGSVGEGPECNDLKKLLHAQLHLNQMSLTAYNDAINLLQVGFDQVREPTTDHNAHALTLNWLVLVSEEFLSLLQQGQLEAIAIVGNYCALLHEGRSFWQISDSGARILEGISDYLGPEWSQWLAQPRSMVFS